MSVTSTISLLALCISAGAASLRPNLVWIMADDMGWGEPGLYPSTSQHGRISTPNLDDFGKSGMVFHQAYAGYTVCAPSRTTLMTGYHSGHFKRQGLAGTTIPSSQSILTIAEMLRSAGYSTAAIGKAAPLAAPEMQGFDHFIGQVDQGLCHNMYPRAIDSGNQTQNLKLPLNNAIPSSKEAARTACMASPQMFNYTVDVTQEQALKWLEQHVLTHRTQTTPKPFFLYQSFTVPHAGGWAHAPEEPEEGAPVPSDGQYASKSWPEVERDHAAVISYLDECVGDLVRKLADLKIENNTMVVFASDNGAHLEGGHDYRFFNSTGGLLGHKRSLFEGGTRSPTMVRWPGTVQPSTSQFPWAFWDVMPTFAELSGATAPSGIDGISIVPTLLGKPQQEHEYLFWTWRGTGVPPLPEGWTTHQAADGTAVYRYMNETHRTHPLEHSTRQSQASGYAIRVGAMKGVVPHCADSKSLQPSETDSVQVYDLSKDPFETTDIAASEVGKAAKAKFWQILKNANVSCGCFQC